MYGHSDRRPTNCTAHPWTLLFADDVMLASETPYELERQVNQWKERLGQFGLRLNLAKTEYLESGSQSDGSILIDGSPLTKTQEFRYLGSRIAASGDTLPDARARVNAAWLKWREVTGILCDRKMPLYLKSKIYRTVVRPVALYGAECWPATKVHERTLHAMEMRMLRWSLGVTRLDHIMNENIRKTCGVAPIQEKMREARLRWYGHVSRADANSVAKRVLALSPNGRRPQGRPKKRWMDCIREDMQIVGAQPDDSGDRAKWRTRCKTADPKL